MIVPLNIPIKKIKKQTTILHNYSEDIAFPVLYIDKDSYVYKSSINTGINFTLPLGYAVHNLHIGKYVSIAAGTEFCSGIDHHYLNLAMGVSDLFERGHNQNPDRRRFKEKGQIIIQNDVWVGHNVTIMPGVVIRNGAIIAANSHVTKDVPPYAVVGGNPARIIKYRFSEEIIEQLQTIQWWYWPDAKIARHAHYFYSEEIEEFCVQFYLEALRERERENQLNITRTENTFLFIPDFMEPFSVWESVVTNFIANFQDREDYTLIVYIEEQDYYDNIEFMEYLHQYINKELEGLMSKCTISMWIEPHDNIYKVFQAANYFITERSKQTARYSCYADQYHLKIIPGTDYPLFIDFQTKAVLV